MITLSQLHSLTQRRDWNSKGGGLSECEDSEWSGSTMELGWGSVG